jgi:hypothetical protein
VLRSASNKDHIVACTHMWRDQTTRRPGHCCMMSVDRAYSLNALQLAWSGGYCGEASKLSLELLGFVGLVEVPPCLSLSPTQRAEVSFRRRQTDQTRHLACTHSWPHKPTHSTAKPDNHLTCPDRTFLPRLALLHCTHAPALLLLLHAATTQLDLPRLARASLSELTPT